ncbi:MAG: PD-(D/E)XK nuclease family protein [Syntrophorhabdales bacterium]
MTIHDELVRRACTPADIGDFARKMTAVLTFIYDHSSARLHPFFHPFAESFVKELDVLGRSRVSGLSFAERSSYFHFFRRYIGYCFSPFEGTPLKGLQVLGFLETRALSFQRTYLVDANEDVIPDTRKEETFLPLRVREMLGLPTYVDRDMIAAYYFDTLVKGSGEVHLFYVENDRKEKSRFVERLLWERQKREAAPSADGYVRSVVYRLSLEGTKLPTIAKTPAMIAFLKARRYDATSLDAYLVCPLKFYYRYVLDLSRKEDASPDIEKVDVGRLVHTVLFRYFETRRGRRLTEAEIDTKEMAAIVRRTCEEAYGPEPIGSAYLLRRQIARQMKAYLIHYQAAVARLFPVTIIDLECRLDATVHGFRARGIIDRIETRGEKTCIVDYKTSASVKRLAIDFDRLDPDDRSTWGKAIGSLQLPFYLFLYGEHHRGRMGDLAASFLLLGKTHVDERIEAPLFRKEERAEADYDKARRVILGLVGEITDPAIPFGADYRAKDPCVFCDYQYLCGTQRP